MNTTRWRELLGLPYQGNSKLLQHVIDNAVQKASMETTRSQA